MTVPIGFWDAVRRIRGEDAGRYAEEAYAFMMDALELTIRRVGVQRHVTAHELLAGLCQCAKDRFGLLAWTVLERWGVRTTSDVGAIVFQLVEAGVLSRRENDARADFDDAFDLRVELEENYFDAGGAAADERDSA